MRPPIFCFSFARKWRKDSAKSFSINVFLVIEQFKSPKLQRFNFLIHSLLNQAFEPFVSPTVPRLDIHLVRFAFCTSCQEAPPTSPAALWRIWIHALRIIRHVLNCCDDKSFCYYQLTTFLIISFAVWDWFWIFCQVFKSEWNDKIILKFDPDDIFCFASVSCLRFYCHLFCSCWNYVFGWSYS